MLCMLHQLLPFHVCVPCRLNGRKHPVTGEPLKICKPSVPPGSI
eukprot:SAG31_NODE_26007_length_450_cov_0.886040_1_plen_43_part_10